MNAKDLGMNLVYKNWLGCFRNTLAACFACASEFGCFGATSFFSWMCMMFFDNWFDWFSTMDRNVFSAAFCILRSCMSFSPTLWTRRMLLEFVRSLR